MDNRSNDFSIPSDRINIYFSSEIRYEGLDEHCHTEHELILITEGSVNFSIKDRTLNAQKNNLVILGDLENHKVGRCEGVYSRYVLSISSEFTLQAIRNPILLSILMQRPADFNHVIKLSDTTVATIEDYFKALIEETSKKPLLWETMISSLLTNILLTTYRDHHDQFPRHSNQETFTLIVSAQEYISKNYNKDITLDNVSSKFFTNKYSFSRNFKEFSGMGFKEYLVQCRLNEAKKFLNNTNMSINDICFAVGYINVNHFIRIFREAEGLSPLQYRKRYNKICY